VTLTLLASKSTAATVNEDEITYIGEARHDDAVAFLANYGTAVSEQLYAAALGDERSAVIDDAELDGHLRVAAALNDVVQAELSPSSTEADYLDALQRAAERCGIREGF
jgi:hypothetical protein